MSRMTFGRRSIRLPTFCSYIKWRVSLHARFAGGHGGDGNSFSASYVAAARLHSCGKSPINALRLGFLDVIAPSARFVHIVRDGIEVARSIERMASATRSMAFRPPLNNWWGINDSKWTAIVHDGTAAGYYPDEVSQLTTDEYRGAYEWMLSVREIDA